MGIKINGCQVAGVGKNATINGVEALTLETSGGLVGT